MLATRVFIIVILGFLTCSSLFALDRDRTLEQFHHTAWTARDGAPSQISALTQTSDGYLWIGSALGLFRYDGVTFDQFEPPDGQELPSHNIYALMATPENDLWISFRPTGLGLLKDGELKIFREPDELPTSQVYSFARTPDGRIWAGTQDGLALFNGKGWDNIGPEWNFQPKTVKTLFTDRTGTLWVSLEHALYYLPPDTKTFKLAEQPGRFVTEMAQAKDGRIWASKFIDIVSPIKDATSRSSEADPELMLQAFGMVFDRDGSLWIAGGSQVTRIRNPEKLGSGVIGENDTRIEAFTGDDGLSGGAVVKIFEDREGNIWVGTMAGLDRFRYGAIAPFEMLEDSTQRLTLAPDSIGGIWVGSAAIDFFQHVNNGVIEKTIPEPQSKWATSLYQDTDGSNWWGANDGIWHQRGKKFRYFPTSKDLRKNGVWEIFRGDGDGGIWVSLEAVGLVYFKDGVWEPRKPPTGLPGSGPSASYEDERKRIWLGYTENRICVVDKKNVRCYTNADGIAISRIKVIRESGGHLWFGGELGLAFFNQDRFYTVQVQGKPLGAVAGIIVSENGDLWISENRGIVNIPRQEIVQLQENPQHAVKYRLYDFLDNLPGAPQMNFTVSTAIETTDKRLWFATDKGLARIDPSNLQKNDVPPSVIVKAVFADEMRSETKQHTKLPAGTSNLQITYTATSLTIPERVVFKYRLKGYEEDWREVGTRREAFYTHLGPGKYSFQVIAANNDGLWNEDGAIYQFEILPLFYQTNWFVFICVAALCLLAWFAYQWRLHHFKSLLQLQFEERLSERTRIAQDLHDTLMQGVVSAAMQLDVATERLGDASPAKPMLNHINGLMTVVIAEGRNALKGLRSPTVNYLIDLEQRFTELRQELDMAEKVAFRTIVTGQPRFLLSAVGEETHKICREALINAFRHSGASVIEVEIAYTPHLFKIVVRDNGCGIDTEMIRQGREGHFGLSGMRERAMNVESRLRVYSRVEGGTEVELSVPGRVAFENQFSYLALRWSNLFRRRRSKFGKEGLDK